MCAYVLCLRFDSVDPSCGRLGRMLPQVPGCRQGSENKLNKYNTLTTTTSTAYANTNTHATSNNHSGDKSNKGSNSGADASSALVTNAVGDTEVATTAVLNASGTGGGGTTPRLLTGQQYINI